jgi:hypothetical protein
MKLKVILVIIAWVFLYIIVYHIYPYLNRKNSGCALTRETYIEEIKGVVRKKFVDSSQHNFETIIYETNDKKQGTMIFATIEYGDMYEYLHESDSIIKKGNSYLYRVKSADTRKDTVFKFETTCKDSLVKSHY